MTCIYSRESGNFNAGDWQKRNKYTDDSALQNFLSGEYSETITELKTQADKKAETWYQGTDPSTSWNATQKAEHEGDLWYNTSNQKTYIYDGSAWQETKSTPPDEVFDEIDGKAQIFVRQPVPPYSVGDLWFNSATSDIMTCITARPSGSYNAKDWEKRNKYTDDSYAQGINDELNRFIEDYNDEIQEIANSIDKKSETWYQTSNPADQWTDNVDNDPLLDTNGNNITDTTGENITTVWEKEKTLHDGDLWHNPNTNKEYIYVDGEWKETSIPDDVFDIIDGKAQIFVSTPTPPYAIGDLWFNSATSDIMTCINGRENGSYASSDWQKRNKYTDDSYAEEVAGDLSNFADQVVGDLENMQTQIDGKIETYYYDYQPTLTNIPASAWTTETERQKHIGDLFYYKSTGFTYRFLKDGSTWKWQAIKDSDIDEALQQAATAQDTADGKRRVFTSTPTPPYDVGDLWAQGDSGDIMRCIRSRSSGNYTSSDWDKASKYTDDSAVGNLDDSLDQQGIFNRLTNNGQSQGIFIRNGDLYINGTYVEFDGATIAGWTISGNNFFNDKTDFTVRIAAPTVYGGDGNGNADVLVVRDKTNDTYPLVISSNGQVLATRCKFEGGTIGGWKITGTDIYNDNGVQSAGIGKVDVSFAFWAGATYANRNTAPFRVGHAGNLIAANANITGSITATSGSIGGWTISPTEIYCDAGSNSCGISKYGTSLAFWAGETVANRNNAIFRVWHDGSVEIKGFMHYSKQGWDTTDGKVHTSIGGWQIKTGSWDGYPTAIYWDTDDSQKNGIAADGPWVVWGGWNRGPSIDTDNYKFVVTAEGVCKAMSWVTGSRSEWKENIIPYHKSAIQEVLDSEVYYYDLKERGKGEWKVGRHIGFVIGDGYNVSPDILNGEGGAVDMYSALAIAYKAIQEQQREIEELKNLIKEAIS